MKKIALSATLLALTSSMVLGQSSYFRFSVGYGIPAATEQLATKGIFTSTQSGFSGTEEGVYGSLGSGVVLNAAYGRMFSKNAGMDINMQYLLGKTYEGGFSSTGTNSSSTISTNGFLLSPCVVLTTGEGKLKPYTKFGFSVGLINAVQKSKISPTTGTTSQTTEIRTEIGGGVSFGFQGGFGIDFGLSEKVNFFTEVVLTSMSFYPNESKVTEFKVDGVDQASMHRTTLYKESVTISSTAPAPSGSTREALQISAPLSSLCLNAGIRLRLKSKE